MNIIKTLREKNGCSQKDLAQAIGVSRYTIIKYENDESTLDVNILKKMSDFFGVDYSCFIDNKLPIEPEYNIIKSKKEEDCTETIRINIPENNIEKFKQVLLYILKKVGAKPNVGQTVLYKLLYFIDFDYYELYEKQLMGLRYIKNNYGPTPVDFNKIIKKMEKQGELEEVKTNFYNMGMTKYLPVKEPDLSLLSAQELEHINSVLDKHSDKTAKEISDFSHKDVPWIMARNKEVLEYEAVFYRTTETSVRDYE